MRHSAWIVIAWLLVFGAEGSEPVFAQDFRECRFQGRGYREGARVCSNGLEVLCSNGSWQNLDGKRCRDRGAYLNPGEAYVVQDPVILVPEPLPPLDDR